MGNLKALYTLHVRFLLDLGSIVLGVAHRLHFSLALVARAELQAQNNTTKHPESRVYRASDITPQFGKGTQRAALTAGRCGYNVISSSTEESFA